jgi:hypothetical protein
MKSIKTFAEFLSEKKEEKDTTKKLNENQQKMIKL